MSIPPEFALVAACCRWPATPARDAAVRAAADRAIDWEKFERVVTHHRVVALVQDGLRRAEIAVPQDTAGRIAAAAASTARTALMMARETVRLQQAFDAATVPVLFVKGSTLAMLAYGELGVKQSWDIDLLTTPECAVAARHVLEDLGYALKQPAGLDDRRFQRLPEFSKECVFLHPALRMSVELHWRLVGNRFLLPEINRGQPAQQVALGGAAVRTLQDEALFAYLCAHGTAHAWVRIKWLADVAALLARREAGETERLYRAALALGAGRTPGVALLLSHRLLGLALAPGLLAELQQDRTTESLVETALHCMLYRDGTEKFPTYSQAAARVQFSHLGMKPGARYFWHELALKWTSPIDRAQALPAQIARFSLPCPAPAALGLARGRTRAGQESRMSLLTRIRALSPRQAALLAEAMAVLAVSAFVVAMIPFRRIAALAGRAPPRGGPEGDARRLLIRDIRWAVGASARRAPWRAKCFEQGLAAQWMLRRRGIPVSLHYGVAQAEGKLTAHVWGQTGAIDVIGCENKRAFAEIARFPGAD